MSGAPDLTQSVIGYRQWRVDPNGTLFSAGGASIPWDGEEQVARCHRQDYGHGGFAVEDAPPHAVHDAPHPKCACGIYAYHDAVRANLIMGRGGYVGPTHTPPAWAVYGAIAAQGRIEVHRDGFRAERARIVCLAFDENWSWAYVQALEDVALARGVALVPRADLAHEARRHGSEIPADLLPKEGALAKLARLAGARAHAAMPVPSSGVSYGYGSGGNGMPVGTGVMGPHFGSPYSHYYHGTYRP